MRLHAIVLAAALAALPGCARKETPVDAATRQQTLLIGNGAEPADLDPQVVTAYTDQNILLALFEGLTAVDEATSQAAPAAAESWAASEDGLTWTFRLREGLRWSNGEPLTSGDFAASWRRILTPSLASEYAYLLYPIRNAQAFNEGRITDASKLGVETPDPRTIRVTLERRTPYFAVLVAQPPWFPVNPRVLARFGATAQPNTPWTRPANFVGNGPFTLQEWSPNSRVVVVRNPAYWDAASVALGKIVFYPTESPDVEERQFRAGQVHATYAVPIDKIAQYRRESPALLRVDPFLQTFFLRFNVRRKPFDDERVRRALSLALDRDLISSHVLSGAYPVARSLTPPNCGGYTSRAVVADDAALARQLLAEAGYPGGRGLPAIEVQVRNDEVQPRVMEAVQEMWRRNLGINVRLATLEQKTWIQNQESLNYAVSTAGWIGDFLDPVTFLDLFVSGGGNNWTGWGDPAYDRLIQEAGQTAEPAARWEVFQRAEAYLLVHGPISPLYHGAHSYLIRPEVRGWVPALLGYHRYARVRLAN